MTEIYKVIISFKIKRSSHIFSYLKQLLQSSLVFMVTIATMQLRRQSCIILNIKNVCEKDILNFVNSYLCLNIKTLKKTRVFCTPFFLKYLRSISVSEKPMTGFSAIKKISQKFAQWTFDMLFYIKFCLFWYQI